MKVSTNLLKQAVKSVCYANSLWYPKLNNVAVKSLNGLMTITVVDLYGMVCVSVPAQKASDKGAFREIVVDARQLSKVVRQLMGSVVHVERTEDGLILSDQNGSYMIMQSPNAPAEMPSFQDHSMPQIANIENVKAFLAELRCAARCSGCALNFLRCVYIRFKDGKIVTMATDGFRIREKTLPATVLVEGLFPVDKDDAKIITEIFKREKSITVKSSDGKMMLESENVKFLCKVYDVEIPNYYPYFDGKFVSFYNVSVNAAKMHQAAKTLANFGAITQVEFHEENFVCLTSDPHHFAGFECVPYAIGDPPEFSMLVNTRYFADMFENVEGNVKIEIGADRLSPILVKADGYRAILMPMRHKEEDQCTHDSYENEEENEEESEE